MDISILPNNNDPEKLVQLDVGMLPVTHGMFQLTGVMSSHRHWHNRVYSQNLWEQSARSPSRSPPPAQEPAVMFVDRYMEKHITPSTLRYNIKRNPLYTDIRLLDAQEPARPKPSWTIKEYHREVIHGNLEQDWKDQETTAKDLDFWLEDLYTPGFDSLLKKKEEEQRRRRLCRLFWLLSCSLAAIVTIIVVPLLLLRTKD